VLPIEKAGQRKYFNMARKKLLSFPNMKRIGITGSYGKTSTKFILGTILSEKYKTYITPQSYNTPMGVSRVINGELTADYEIFVSEMGARHVGDIKEMCDLVNPEYGIITSIGPQHLETFKTIETVASTKYELIEALPEGGHAFFPDDGAYGKACYDKCGTAKTLFGLSPIDGVYASDFSFSYAGCLFTLHDGKGGSIKCRTKLLGQHNIQNITGAAAVALELGLTLEEIAAGIEKIAPVEHRLQIMDTNNGITVIDDSFNSNPVGCKAAMEILRDFPGRHIVITPGLVELGDAEEAENRSFGEAMAKAADIAILVGEKRSRPIKEGLIAAGFDSNNIIIVNSLNEASARLANITQIGDTVLFENDLPDNYDE
ncbi:MAG: UDP-N-acetylmuramoyl-tripeptide--D-alanyl-D-alanine ligase, partial [Oscillospiraceae bacterium]|nr:UDP-N-acetylmuramoyl-tripeptide--D-alanyl-D-alanine ligase [Oscillospiraceae bacterium]